MTAGTYRAHPLRMTLARNWFPAILLLAIVLGAAPAQAQPPGGDADGLERLPNDPRTTTVTP